MTAQYCKPFYFLSRISMIFLQQFKITKKNTKTTQTSLNYRVGALNWSIFVLVLLLGKGVTLLDARYGDGDGIDVENAAKYSAANAITSSGFRSNRNCMKSARSAFSSGWWRIYLPWSAFNSSYNILIISCDLPILTGL